MSLKVEAAEDLQVNDLVKFNENGTVSLAGSSYIYVDGEQKNYATLEADNAALKEEVAELRRIVEDHLSKGADFGHGGL